MNCPVKDETYLCETPCTDKCAYYEGAREFKEWLISKYGYSTEDIEKDFAEWQKGAENEI